MALGVYYFKFPNNFTFGGLTGFMCSVKSSSINLSIRYQFSAKLYSYSLGRQFGEKFFGIQVIYASTLYLAFDFFI